jgi:membrane protein DedA with SNARE-associated domain
MLLSHLGDLVKSWFNHFGYGGVALAMAIESCLIPLPSELVMPVAGAFAAGALGATVHLSLIGVSFAGAIGGTIGSAVAYWIGATGGRPAILKYGRYILISRHDFDMADRAFTKHGGAIAFFSRLMPVIRTYISLPAGITRMNFTRFLIYTFLGSLPWCFVLAFAGYKLGPQAEKVGSYLHGLDYVVVAAAVILVGLYVWRHIRHERAYDEKLAAQNGNDPPTQKLPTIDQESTRKMPRAR